MTGLFTSSEQNKKDIVTGKGYDVLYDGEKIRVINVETMTKTRYSDLEDHLLAGYTLFTSPITEAGASVHGVRLILLKPGKSF